MPIANCGFPLVTIAPGTDPPQFISGRDALVMKGPTTGVEIGFNPDFFIPIRPLGNNTSRRPLHSLRLSWWRP